MDDENRREKEFQKELEKLDLKDNEFFKELELDDDDFVFHGRVADLEKVRQYRKLCLAAQLLRERSSDVEKVQFFDPSPSEDGCNITVTFRRLFGLFGEAHEAFAYLTAFSDGVVITCAGDGPIRIAFTVSDVWRE